MYLFINLKVIYEMDFIIIFLKIMIFWEYWNINV